MRQDELIDTKGLAQRSGLSASYWNKRRVSGDTPPYLKCGGRVLYRISDVEAWLQSKRRTSTSDRGPCKPENS